MSFPNGVVPTTERVHPTPPTNFSCGCSLLTCCGGSALVCFSGRNPQAWCFAPICSHRMARFLVEIIRLNPRSFLRMSNAKRRALLPSCWHFLYFFFVRRNNDAAAPARHQVNAVASLLLINHAFLHHKCYMFEHRMSANGSPSTAISPLISQGESNQTLPVFQST